MARKKRRNGRPLDRMWPPLAGWSMHDDARSLRSGWVRLAGLRGLPPALSANVFIPKICQIHSSFSHHSLFPILNTTRHPNQQKAISSGEPDPFWCPGERGLQTTPWEFTSSLAIQHLCPSTHRPIVPRRRIVSAITNPRRNI